MVRRYIDESRFVDEHGWTRWIEPIERGYKMRCCDCGLVHSLDFRVDDGKAQFRVRRDNRSTAMSRYHSRRAL